MPNLRRLLKYVHATSSAFFFHQNISKNTYFQITKKNDSEISLHVHCKARRLNFVTSRFTGRYNLKVGQFSADL